MTARPIITLTTDFGLRDPYVAAMKGVILEIAPEATVLDISHEIPPQNVAEGAYVLAGAAPYFPDGTVHVVVVDPGVGTRRKAIAVKSGRSTFVGPDNGLLCPALIEQGAVRPDDGRLDGGMAVELTNSKYHRHPVSRTFHGRDIFSPAAAHLVRGVPIESLGPRLDRLVCSVASGPTKDGAGVRGAVVHIDRFGNAVTNLRAGSLPADPHILVGGRTIEGISPDYQAAELSAIVGSLGYLEIAVRNGSAAAGLGLNVGDEVIVR